MISESSLTSEHYFLNMTQISGKKTISGQALVDDTEVVNCPVTGDNPS